MKFQTCLTIFTFIYQLKEFTTTGNDSKTIEPKSSIEETLRKIAKFFPDCNLVYFEDVRKPQISSDIDLEALNQVSAGAYYLTGYNRNNITFPSHTDIHRYTYIQCSLAISYFSVFNTVIQTWFVKTLLPRYGPILRKDEDYFIFISDSELVSEKFLLSNNFGGKIRYKLGLTQSPNNIVFKMVELFGGAHDSPKLVTSPQVNVSLFTKESVFGDLTNQVNGKSFRFSVPKVDFRLEIRMNSNGKYYIVRGFYKWYLDEVTKKFNFTFDLVRASFGGGTGKRLENGTWVGALGDVLYGKADFSTMVGLIYSRHQYIGWSSALSYEWMVFATSSPKKSYSPKAIFWPFTPIMWLLFLITLFIVTVSLKIISRLGKNASWGFVKTFEYIFSTFLEKDASLPMKTSSVRILASFWLIFAMVTATVHRGKLVSLIAFPVNTWIPVTFESLANSNFKVALNLVGKAGASYAWIVSSPNPIIRKLANRVEYINEGEKCLERAMTEELGCILWKGVKDYVMVKNLTDRNGHAPLEESEETAMFIKDGFNFEKRAIFGRILDQSIQAAVQMGLTLKWRQMDEQFIKKERNAWLLSKNKTTNFVYNREQGAKKLVVSQFTGLFLLSSVGILSASIQFSREMYSICSISKLKIHFKWK